ncbi:MAG: TlpA family protein disulfide reductase [Thermoanaerobaculia bacterium]
MNRLLRISILTALAAAPISPVRAAETAGASGLTLAPALSFTDDSSSNFPIRGRNIGDGEIAAGQPTIVFFGTSHCWNTNREAERLVAFYAKHQDDARFLVVDLNHPTRAQKKLVDSYYHGYIPTLAFLDAKGTVVYDRAGETSRTRSDISGLEEIFKKAR